MMERALVEHRNVNLISMYNLDNVQCFFVLLSNLGMHRLTFRDILKYAFFFAVRQIINMRFSV
jgi:hypothetical protein